MIILGLSLLDAYSFVPEVIDAINCTESRYEKAIMAFLLNKILM